MRLAAVLRRRSASEFFENPIELRERLKSHSERDFTDAQMWISQEITRVLEPSVRDVVDKIYAGYLFEILAQVIRVHVDRFCDSGQGELFARVFVDILARFPNRDWLSSISRSGVFEFSSRRHLYPLNDLTLAEQFCCSSVANFSPDLAMTGNTRCFKHEQFLQSKSQGTRSTRPVAAV